MHCTARDPPPFLPPAKRQKSQTPILNGWSRDATNGTRDPTRGGPLTQSRLVVTPSPSDVTSNGVSSEKQSQQIKRSPWGPLSKFSYPGLSRDELALEPKRERSPSQQNGLSRKAASPLLERITAAREAARSETPSISKNHDIRRNPPGGSQLRRHEPSGPSRPLDSWTKPLTKPVHPHSHASNPSRPNNESPQRPSSSSQKLVSVEIPLRSGTTPAPRNTPSSQSNIEVRIPLGGLKAERKQLFQKLRQSTQLAKERPEQVHRVFGQTGFSPLFSVEDDHERMRNLASKKKKKAPQYDTPLSTGNSLVSSLQRLQLGEMVHPADSARDVLTSRFDENIVPPLTFANDVNQRRLNGKFQFTDRYIIGEGIKMAPASTNVGCSCKDCERSTCLCFTKAVPDAVGKGVHHEQIRTYVRRPDGIVVLSDKYIANELNPDPRISHFEVTECNDLCACGPDCWNRVVGKGRTVPLEIFETSRCGFGVRSSQDIVKGQFIELYLGEVITEAELRRREDTAEEEEPSYIYSLDWFGTPNDKHYHVDGKYFGSAMRFVNHSCDPNARCFPVQLHKGDKRVYLLAFFAIQDIKAGVEIRISYEGRDSIHHDPDSDAKGDGDGEGEGDEELVRCYCGAKNCRKFLWPSNVKARRRRRKLPIETFTTLSTTHIICQRRPCRTDSGRHRHKRHDPIITTEELRPLWRESLYQ
ncbi:hypothetical protein A1O1_04216 [Capronia coronata CBS 617.96]|uniref:Histone-lysine N-methyltransferase SUV39H n=1 Tax=Capronia coronata CBS 617.96 TaxID=1182541 RepID=W9Z9C0_9EURO|nr:uncharacterized protein A1O1_04216 [Capronia coronata CBS 617.96]EXJ91109.1 hypothetical protein A1O1_04216 [Capronia coronata CBS 617.96]